MRQIVTLPSVDNGIVVLKGGELKFKGSWVYLCDPFRNDDFETIWATK